MREKLIELIHSGAGCPDNRHPFGDACEGCEYIKSQDCGTERLADYLLAHGVNICIGGEYLPREDVIKGVLKQMQASSSPKCMEEFLRNLNGVTLAEDNNVLSKWVSGAIPPKESGYYLVVFTDKFTGIRKFCIDFYIKCAAGEWWENDFGRDVTHWMPLPVPPMEVV